MTLLRWQSLVGYWIGLSLRTRGLAILTVPALCLVVALLVFGSYKESLAEDKRQVLQTKQIKLQTKRLLIALAQAERGVQNYGLTRNPVFLKTYEAAIATIPTFTETLQSFTRDRPERHQQLIEIKQLLAQSLEQLQQQLAGVGVNGQPVKTTEVHQWLQQDDLILSQTRQQIERFVETQELQLEKFQDSLEKQQQRGWMLLWGLVGVGTVGTGLAALLFQHLIQELSQRELQLQESNQRLSDLNERLHRFTADASHELRAPLAAILGQAQAGLLAPEDDRRIPRQRLERIVGITKSMSVLVSNLLFLARDEGSARLSSDAIDLVPFCQQLAEEYQHQSANDRPQFSLQLPDTPVLVKVDSDLLRQAVINLLNNAWQYTPAGGSVQLRLEADEKRAYLQVEDTGIGIADEDLPYVFDRFYRVDRVRSKTGFGLGLAIVQQIAQSYGGQVTVKSILGQGSIFQISLPRS